MIELKDEDIIYRKLQEHLDKMPIGFPRAESGSDVKLLKILFTPEEAKIATFLNFSWYRDIEPLNQIYERMKSTGISLQELENYLDNMAKKGTILSKKEENMKYYANAALMIGIYEFKVDKLSEEFLQALVAYIREIWGKQANPTNYEQMRYIPVEVEIEPEQAIAQYDNVKTIIEQCEGPFVKVNCVCRQTQDLLGEPCKMTNHRDNCLGFGDMAQMYIDQGYGVDISKEETLQILKRNREEGLILRPNNSQKIDFICSCCYCCDGSIANLQEMPEPGNFILSNYYSQVDSELCTGCGTCQERCLFNAITLIDDIASIERKRCIGCGNCISTCPSEAIFLQKKEQEIVPPPTMDDLYNLIQKEKIKMKK
jgi:electron transport complex protein RnfB